IVSIFRFSLLGVYSGFTGPKYDIAQFNIIKLLFLIVITIVYHFVSVNIISNSKRDTKVSKKDRITFILILVLLLSSIGYKFYKDAGKEFYRGVKEASKTGIVTIYENSIEE
ncbi:MAG: hypothetical protein E6900_03650, partial [Gemella haemolysans]|nr:hypothetical protein [Gemella haemolysans]